MSNRTQGLPSHAEQARSESTRGRDTPRPSGNPPDRVEISDAAANYDPRAEAERATKLRIGRIREAIADDTYLTPNKIDVAVERLYAELAAEKQATAEV